MGNVTDADRKRLRSFPAGVFMVIVGAVCLGLAANAGYDFVRLNARRGEYLRKSAAETVAALDLLARGPARRAEPEIWQSLFAESLGAQGSSVAFLALLDGSGQVLAGQGARFATVFTGETGFVRAQGTSLYIYEADLTMPRMGMGGGGPPGMVHRPAPLKIRVGMYSSSADFIRWQAVIHLAINSVAIVTLIALSRYLLRTINRFLQLKAREESARHLTALGSMAATLAHEIRNPLGAMKGLTQLAQEDLPGDHKTQSMMSTVVREAERLEQLVTDLLSFARPRDPQISRFDFRHLLTDVADVLRPKLESSRIQLEVVPGVGDLMVDSDESGLRQILLNILLNAMDVTPAGGTITVRIGRDDRTRVLTAEVDDSGPGLDGRDPEELFQPFATTKTKGTGLGLPISRQIAERLGGTLVLAGRPEGGARCTLTLPMREGA